MDAAKAIISSFEAQGVPPIAHSVFINTSVNGDGEFERRLVVAVNPRYRTRIRVPETVQGIPVIEGKWGRVYRPDEVLTGEKEPRSTLAAPRQDPPDAPAQ